MASSIPGETERKHKSIYSGAQETSVHGDSVPLYQGRSLETDSSSHIALSLCPVFDFV